MGYLVEAKEIPFWQRMRARFIWPLELQNHLFLAYCGEHGYYVDSKHTGGFDKGGPRCPACDHAWLRKRGIL